MRISDWSSDVCSSDLTEKISALLDPTVKTIVHIPSVNSRESLKDKHREAEDNMNHLGDWQRIDPETGSHLIKTAPGNVIKELGRASCRERVWQYVYISLAAVSLNRSITTMHLARKQA